MKPVIFHRAAEGELDDAVAYYEGQRAGLGLDLQSEVEKMTDLIQQFPQRWPLYKDSGYRRCSVHRFPYNIFYMELEDSIWIAAMAHKKRRPGYWMGRTPES